MSSAATHPALLPTKSPSPEASTASNYSTTAPAGGSSASSGMKKPPQILYHQTSPPPPNNRIWSAAVLPPLLTHKHPTSPCTEDRGRAIESALFPLSSGNPMSYNNLSSNTNRCFIPPPSLPHRFS